jgi:hypothetical protein
MSTSSITERGTQFLLLRQLVLPVTACALTLLIGCGGGDGDGAAPGGGDDVVGDGGDGGGDDDPIPDPPTAPTFGSIDPTTGPPEGGTPVVILGSGFLDEVEGATEVTFAGVAAMDVVVVNDTEITAVAPAGDDDTFATIVVENSRGVASLDAGFHYLATAVIISDLNSDGHPDVIIAAPNDGTVAAKAGTVYVFYGSEGVENLSDAPAAAADVTVRGAAGDLLGSALATGDVNDDGHIDLVVGSPYADLPSEDAGTVSIFLGPLPDSAMMDSSEADIVFSGEGFEPGFSGDTEDHFGSSLSLGDVDGDGVLDILVGAPDSDGAPDESPPLSDAGRAYVFLGGEGLVDTLAADAAVILAGVKKGRNFGSAVCIVDIDGDGHGELAIAGSATWSSHSFGGDVFIFRGDGLESGTTHDADLRIGAEGPGDQFGAAITAGDFDADGIEDLMVGAPNADLHGYSNGCVYIFLGRSGFDTSSANEADVALGGYFSNTSFGSGLASADVNGDGYGDVLVGAPRYSLGANKNGRVFVFYGLEDPLDELAGFCNVIYTGEEINNGGFGTSVGILDCDQDGKSDLMSSAVGVDSAAGRVYLFRGKDAPVDAGAADDDRTISAENQGGKFGSAISRGK